MCIRSLVLIHYSRTLVTRRRRRLLSTRNACVHEASYIIGRWNARRQARPLLTLDVEDLSPFNAPSADNGVVLGGIPFYRVLCFTVTETVVSFFQLLDLHTYTLTRSVVARPGHLLIFDELCFNYIELSAVGCLSRRRFFFAADSRASYFAQGVSFEFNRAIISLLFSFFFFFFFLYIEK